MKSDAMKIVFIDREAELLYPEQPADSVKNRIGHVAESFSERFGRDGARLFSAPGRAELGGNHTDHQRGQVIAAAVAQDDIAAALPNSENVIRIFSEAFEPIVVKTDELAPRQAEKNTSAALVRGTAEYISKNCGQIRGFDACVSGMVPVGSGLSSSAAFEVLVAGTINGLFFGGEISCEETAKAAQYAENVHFGKPSGLMDQMSSASGGVIKIDFKKPKEPEITRLKLNPADFGYALCVIDTRSNHEKLTCEYNAITIEMRSVAELMGGEVLSDISPETFYAGLPKLRGKVSDRALLRAVHFFDENKRVSLQAAALENRDFETFLRYMRESGRSSWEKLQSIYAPGAVAQQPAALALSWCERLLNGDGACRIHGGGFGGTIQAFVPLERIVEFRNGMEKLTGAGSCLLLPVRPVGIAEIVY